MRVHPITGKRKKHRGVDVGYNGPIYAPANGKVVHKGVSLNKRTGGGYTLILEHSEPRVWTVYYHLREPSKLLKGTQVKRGEVIAHTGTTGASTGVHLHFETRRSRRWGTDFDPETVIDMSRSAANGATPGQSATPAKPVAPSNLKVDGIMGRGTWTRFQQYLQRLGHYTAKIDGKPGPQTYRALQAWLNEVF
jgi:murein DD-endopeptidase MepM/ murein hydrolase activator NlpD